MIRTIIITTNTLEIISSGGVGYGETMMKTMTTVWKIIWRVDEGGGRVIIIIPISPPPSIMKLTITTTKGDRGGCYSNNNNNNNK